MGRPRAPQGVGSKTVRLADVPAPVRMAALRKLIDQGYVVDPDEIASLFALAIAPGDKGGRVE
jgi:hypothetical protein